MLFREKAMRYLAVVLLAALSLGVQAQTYRWVDSNGRTVFSDTPPTGKARAKSTTTASDPGDGLPFATKRASEAFPVILYTSADCTDDCKRARDLLSGRGVPFTEKMVQKQAEYDELKDLVGDAFVPSIKVGNQRSRGFDAPSYHNLLDLAGYPKTAPYRNKPADGQSK